MGGEKGNMDDSPSYQSIFLRHTHIKAQAMMASWDPRTCELPLITLLGFFSLLTPCCSLSASRPFFLRLFFEPLVSSNMGGPQRLVFLLRASADHCILPFLLLDELLPMTLTLIFKLT